MDKVLIKDIAEVVNGSTPSTKENSYWDGNIPWITPKDLSAISGRYISNGERNITKEGYQSCSTTLVPKNTILLTSRAPIGYLAIAKNDLCTNQGFKSLICNQSRILPLYMFYWLSTKIEFLKSISGGATFKELSKTSLENVVMDLPNIVQQQHIVDTIGSVDDLIENYEERISFLQKISSYLYLQLIKHSRETSYLGNFIKIETGSMNLDENDPNGRYPFYTRNIGTFYSNKYTNEGKGAVVAGEGNFTPKFVNGKFGLHQRAYFIQPSTTKLGSEVIYEIILSNKKYLESVAVGSTVKSLRRFCFEQMPFFIDADYFCLNQILEILFGEIENFKKRKSILLNQKRILLDKYF